MRAQHTVSGSREGHRRQAARSLGVQGIDPDGADRAGRARHPHLQPFPGGQVLHGNVNDGAPRAKVRHRNVREADRRYQALAPFARLQGERAFPRPGHADPGDCRQRPEVRRRHGARSLHQHRAPRHDDTVTFKHHAGNVGLDVFQAVRVSIEAHVGTQRALAQPAFVDGNPHRTRNDGADADLVGQPGSAVRPTVEGAVGNGGLSGKPDAAQGSRRSPGGLHGPGSVDVEGAGNPGKPRGAQAVREFDPSVSQIHPPPGGGRQQGRRKLQCGNPERAPLK